MASDGAVKVSREAFAAALRRLDAQLEQARKNSEALEERSQEYRELRGLLKELPSKVSHEIMVPFGPLASFPGQLVHTNEVLTQLSSEYFALRTADNAIAMVDRRLRRLDEEQRSASRELRELTLRRRLASGEAVSAGSGSGGSGQAGASGAGASEVSEVPGVPGATTRVDEDGFLDIREPLDREEEEPKFWKSRQSPTNRGADDTLSRLRELERMEEDSESGHGRGSLEEEMSELDHIMDSYANAAPESKAPEPSSGSRPHVASSPADLFRLMEASVAEAEPERSTLERAGVADAVRERAEPQGRSEPEDAPKRVSKFKADRQKEVPGPFLVAVKGLNLDHGHEDYLVITYVRIVMIMIQIESLHRNSDSCQPVRSCRTPRVDRYMRGGRA